LNIYFSDLFLDGVQRLSVDAKKALKKKLDILADNPKHPSMRTKKIKGGKDIFEASVNMDIRITWEFFEDVILLRNIGRHDKTLNNQWNGEWKTSRASGAGSRCRVAGNTMPCRESNDLGGSIWLTKSI
jgi:mRNA-degrading endonuclease YafQ of YafQ-DinJ toxin-antitoxin module